MVRNILITGGAGFVGSHVADALLRKGCNVRVLDSLLPQVHGEGRQRPLYLSREVELVIGDIRDSNAVQKALRGIDGVYHFAARVGVGQSMYEITEYNSVNTLGTAVLLEALVRCPVERLVVASSMSVYGEGSYRKAGGKPGWPSPRTLDQLRRGDWEVRDMDGSVLEPVPTREEKPVALQSVYALTKFDQEQMCLAVAATYGFSATALRFFNIYGTRQSLSNPYTGVLAIFASRLLNRRAPLINEDGEQRRDFVHVSDIAQACLLALQSDRAVGQVVNVGSGQPVSIREVADAALKALGVQGIEPVLTGKYRAGDIRHCYADISRAKDLLGYQPATTLSDGLQELAAWLQGQQAVDRVEESRAALATRGLML